MNNVTASARLTQQQNGHQSTSTAMQRFQSVYENIPDETEQFLQLSEEFIHMGSAMLASAYVSKCLEYMKQARGALIQNMSVAGSIMSGDIDSRSSVVGPWINQNRTFMNRTGAMSSQMSFIGPSNTTTFKRPLPGRAPSTTRKTLNPIHESHVFSSSSSTVSGLAQPPPSNVRRVMTGASQVLSHQSQAHSQYNSSLFRHPGSVAGSEAHFARPAAPMASSGDSRNYYATSSDSDVRVKPSRGRSKVVRSTPIRPDVPTRGRSHQGRGRPRANEHYLENDENLFAAISPLSVHCAPSQHNGAEADKDEDDLLTKNSPSTRSNTKLRRVVKVVKRVKPLAAHNPPANSTSREELNSTITRHGRVSKPPKKFSFMQDNSILSSAPLSKKLIVTPPLPPPPPSSQQASTSTGAGAAASAGSKPAVTSTASKPEKKRKLLPTVEDEVDVTVRNRKKLLPTVDDDLESTGQRRKVKEPKLSHTSTSSAASISQGVPKGNSSTISQGVPKSNSSAKRAPTPHAKRAPVESAALLESTSASQKPGSSKKTAAPKQTSASTSANKKKNAQSSSKVTGKAAPPPSATAAGSVTPKGKKTASVPPAGGRSTWSSPQIDFNVSLHTFQSFSESDGDSEF